MSSISLNSLSGTSSGYSTPASSVPTKSTRASSVADSTIAFAFDIDGVLVRSKEALPGATESLQLLQQRNIPFIFLTNGGGATEKDHVAVLAKRLNIPSLHERQFVQSHSPFHELVPELANKNILVLGGTGSSIRDVAAAYGFKQVVTSADLIKTFGEHVYPFLEMEKDHHEEHGREIESRFRMPDGRVQISAILVWSSPRSWGLDYQVVMDLLLSEKGIFGTVSSKNGDASLHNRGYLQDGQPMVYFSNPDQNWATAYHLPRVAQGSWRLGLQGIWDAHTGNADISSVIRSFGKPSKATYIYGERVLQKWNREINGEDAPVISTVYMVGDNPASDIAGANVFESGYGSDWKSILVESGVHVAGTKPAYLPDHTVGTVKEAVDLALWLESKS
ncbi:hypothetical protein LZ554_000165 [Drepanopeziza brunnea f. sp. 'monogermtubi']|nr:hypothetical protein LZ554_000165 [Drepanopeziza brunnea f. sp. 'monogermtubi']